MTAKRAEIQNVGGIEAHDTLTISANNIPHQTAYAVETLLHLQPFYAFPYRHIDGRRPTGCSSSVPATATTSPSPSPTGPSTSTRSRSTRSSRHWARRYHPSHPYQDPRVTVHIDDGRAFIERDTGRYDLIMFALPDSLTLFAGQGSLRLENYLFTKESMTRCAASSSRAAPSRCTTTTSRSCSTGTPRRCRTSTARRRASRWAMRWPAASQAVLVAGAGATESCARRGPVPRAASPTDDYPFPYLQSRTIPSFYRETLLLMLGASLLLIRAGGRPLPQHDPLHRSCVHGRRLPPARDQERRAVRAAVSAPPGSSTRSCSPACCSACTWPSSWLATSGCPSPASSTRC